MAIQYVGGIDGVSTGTSPITVDLRALTGGLDTSPSTGDVVIVHMTIGGGTLIPLELSDTDYITIDTETGSGGNSARRVAISAYYKFMGEVVDSDVIIPSFSTSYEATYHVQVWRGVDSTTPMDVTPVTYSGAEYDLTGLPLTVSTDGAVVVAFGGYGMEDATNNPYPRVQFADYQMQLMRNGSTRAAGSGVGSMLMKSGETYTALFEEGGYGGNASITYALRPENPGYSTKVKVVGFTDSVTTGASSGTTVSLESLTGGKTSAPTEGDLVIVSIDKYSVITDIVDYDVTGYTLIGYQSGNDSYSTGQALYYKVMTATPDTSIEVFSPGNADKIKVYVFRGIDTSQPFDVTTTSGSGINTGVIDTPSITPLTAETLVVSMGVSHEEISGYGGRNASLTGYGNTFRDHNSGVVGVQITSVMATKVWSGSGAEDPGAWTNLGGGTSSSWVGFTLAIKQVVPVTVTTTSRVNLSLSGISPTTVIMMLINAVKMSINYSFKLPGTFIQKMFNEDKPSTTITNEPK